MSTFIWQYELRGYEEKYFSFLNPTQKLEASKIRCVKSRAHFIIGRLMEQYILAQYIDSSDLHVQRNRYGKPTLRNNKCYFNLTHSNTFVLFALNMNHSVGIDIEYIRNDINIPEVSVQFCSSHEYAYLLNCTAETQTTHFFKLWTQKEALHKCMGVGFSKCPTSTDLSKHVHKSTPFQYGNYSIVNLQDIAGYSGALCVMNTDFQYTINKFEI